MEKKEEDRERQREEKVDRRKQEEENIERRENSRERQKVEERVACEAWVSVWLHYSHGTVP